MLEQPILIAVREKGQLWEYRGTEDELGAAYRYTPKINKEIDAEFYGWETGYEPVISVPVGFRCDGASSPRILWSLTGFLPRGIHDPAALVHDYLYEEKGLVIEGVRLRHQYSRKECDQIFLEMLKACGVMRWHAYGAYLAVRLGGWYYWNK